MVDGGVDESDDYTSPPVIECTHAQSINCVTCEQVVIQIQVDEAGSIVITVRTLRVRMVGRWGGGVVGWC